MYPINEGLEKVLEDLKAHPKVIAIYLFGSYAKGCAKPLSDIDVAVIIDKPDPATEAELGSLYSEKLDVVLFHRLPLYIQFEVFRYGKELFVRDADKLFEIRLSVLRGYLEHSWLYRRMEKEVLK